MATAAKKPRAKPNRLIDKKTFSTELFCREYIIDRNGTRAVIAAGYSDKGYAPRTQAHKLLSDPNIIARIQRLMTERLKAADITAERVMLALARIAFAGDLRDLYDADGKFLPPHTWNDDLADAMSGIDVDEKGNVIKVRRNQRDAALGHLARHFKIVGPEIDDRLREVSAVAERLERANARAARMRKEAAK